MRAFASQLEAIKEIERDLWELGITVKGEKVQSIEVGDKGWTRELYGYSYSLPLIACDEVQALEHVGLVHLIDYIDEEFKERVSGGIHNPGNSWGLRADYWTQHLESAFDGSKRFAYTYSERMSGNMIEVLSHLEKERYSRQAIVSIWDREKDTRRQGVMRVPCSMYYQFMIREVPEPSLLMIYDMRSCDLYTHFPIDQTLGLRIGRWVAGYLGVRLGFFIHKMNSLHAYYTDLQKRGIF